MNINRVLITGNLTHNPELKEHGATKVCRMRVAVNNRVKQNDEWTEKPCFFDVVAFGKQAENCAQYLGKGRPVAVDGRLDWNEWEKDGQKRQAVQIIANVVQFLDSGKSEGQGEPVATAATSGADDDIPF